MKQYVAIGRAKASVIFGDGDLLGLDYNLSGRRLHIEMGTRRLGTDREVIGDLQVIAISEADNVEEAAALLTRGREMALMVSLATNAYIGPVEGELVYETSSTNGEHEFFQRFMPADTLSYADRALPLDATSSLIEATVNHPQRNRLIRGMSQYSLALSYWETGNELLALSHLFMGVEAIKTAYWRHLIAAQNITMEGLATDWGFQNSGRIKLVDYLNREARIRGVFRGDTLHHQIAKKVSDSFEHGFANGGELYAKAASTLMPTAAHLRNAMLQILEVPEPHLSVLLGDKFSQPRGPAGIEQYFRGVLIAPEGTRLAAPGYDHPFCHWEIEIEAKRDEERRSTVYTHNPKMTAMIGEGVMLRPTGTEVFGRGTFAPASAAEQASKN